MTRSQLVENAWSNQSHLLAIKEEKKNTKRHWYNALGGKSVIFRCLVLFRVKTFIFGLSDQDDFFVVTRS